MTDAWDLREGESVEQFAARMKASHTAPTWAELRTKTDHADDAYRFLSSAPMNGDAAMAKVMVDAATVHATLALHDKLDELSQTLKYVIGSAVETDAELSQTIKTATRAVVTEIRKATIREVA